LNGPVTLLENRALFHSLRNLLLTNNHVSNSELQCKKFSYRVVIKVATNGTYHKISIVKPTRCTNFSNLFYFGITLHVSDGHSIRHQDFTTVHTATEQILLLLASKQTAVSVRQMPVAVCTILNS
jgi:hypothetical protein